MHDVIVLNADFQPLGVVTLRKAMVYLLHERATIVEAAPGLTQRSTDAEYPVPLVVQFRQMMRVPYLYRPQPWTRRGVLMRDARVCAFCGLGGATTVDHIMPRSRFVGDPNVWTNTISSCSACNNRKGARTPEEAGMPLRFQPRELLTRDTLLLAMASTGADLAALGLA